MLRCRTAYIGIFIMGTIAFAMHYHGRIRTVRRSLVILVAVIVCLLVGFLSVYMYRIKQSSADGRIFIWKQTFAMIVDNPAGVGYGMFERSYNNYVSEYFATHETERKHSILTSRVISAYNDYLEQGAEGGIAGMLFLVGFYIFFVWETIRRRDVFSLSIVVAYMVMSAVNFIILTNIPWLLFLCVTSMIKSSDKEKLYFLSNQKLTILPLLLISLLVLFLNTRFIIAQSMLKQYKDLYKQTNSVTKSRLDSLRNMIGTSEAYYTFYSEYSAASGDYQKAIEYGREALRYTSSPNLMLSVSDYYERNRDLPNAISMMKRLSDMLPGNFSTKYLMLLLYEKAGNHSAARTMAVEITEKPVKIESEETSYIKAYAMRYLNQSLCE
ncbi:MAG: O-antigen ligase family protein [Bacteroidaceae bacterium]|nr:O-antigen ligase family protein [Bacteroidaceae bacterium]